MNSPICTQLQCAEFYKSWDRYGALSNFSAHPVSLPDGPISASGCLPDGPFREWPSVEHFYQAQKFAGAALFSPLRHLQTATPDGKLTQLALLAASQVSIMKVSRAAQPVIEQSYWAAGLEICCSMLIHAPTHLATLEQCL